MSPIPVAVVEHNLLKLSFEKRKFGKEKNQEGGGML